MCTLSLGEMKKYFHYFITLELKALLLSLIKTGGFFFVVMFTLNFFDKFLFGENFDTSVKSSLAIWLPLLKGAMLISLVPMVSRAYSKWLYLEKHELTNSNFNAVHESWKKQ
jgi:hypothetical protein